MALKSGTYSKARAKMLTTPPTTKNAATVPVQQAQCQATGATLLGAPAFAAIKNLTTSV
jgi:hypothetical protein